ncbi:MAG TPA: TonB-dependent siderophore receptor [Burkholderiales bacterium]|nr:TonB-dependent siderophore receptor [Burkholderiales bacterium]
MATAVAAALAATFNLPAHAQQSTEQDTTLPEIKVQDAQDNFRTDSTRSATRTETPLRDIPQFINTVPQALIRSQNASTLQEALRNVPGISYAAPEGGTQVNQVFFLRGFPIFDNLFVDGVRDLGEYNRDLFATESVEVLKGPSALMFGRGNPGGVINQTSKVADRLERREVSATVGSFNQKRATADLNLRTGDSSAVRLIALAEDSGSYRYPQGVEKYGFAPSLWANLGKATDLTLSWYYLKEHSVTDYGQPTLFVNQGKGRFLGFSNVSPKTYYGFANNDFSDYETNIATAKVEHQFNDKLSLRNVFRWATYKRRSEASISEGIRPLDANGAPVTASTPLSLIQVTRNHDTNRSRDNADDAVINQTELTWKAVTGTIKHTVLGGLELGRERLNRHNNQLDANPALAGVQAPSMISPILAPDPYDALSYGKQQNQQAIARGETVAVYAQDQIEFSEHWKALVGLRWERYKSTAQTIGVASGVASAGPFGRTDNMLSGRAGLVWQPTRMQSYYVSWGNSYNPSGQLNVGDSAFAGAGGTTAQTNLNAINQNLGPEKNQNYEAGAQWDVGGLQVRSAVFRNEKTNARQLDSTGTTTVLGGERRVDGIEFEASGSITRNWDLYSGIAFMRGKIIRSSPFGALNTFDPVTFATTPAPAGSITDVTAFCARADTTCVNVNGNTPAMVPRVAGSIWTVYRLGGGVEVGGGARGQEGAWLTDRNDPGTKIPAYVVFDATAAYVQKNYEVRLNVYNVLDKFYYVGGYNNRPDRVLPGQPRAASLTVRYNFN